MACQQNTDGFDVSQAAAMCRSASPELATAQYPARELDPQLQPSEAEKERLGAGAWCTNWMRWGQGFRGP